MPWRPPFAYEGAEPEFAELVEQGLYRSHVSGMGHGCPEGSLHLDVLEDGGWQPALDRFRFELTHSRDRVRIVDVAVCPARRRQGWGRQAVLDLASRCEEAPACNRSVAPSGHYIPSRPAEIGMIACRNPAGLA